MPSALESLYAARAGAALRQFGYDLFAGTQSAAGLAVGGVPGDYVLGIGDEVLVALRGQTVSSRRHVIDGEGRLLIDELPPIIASGRTLTDVRAELEATVAASLIETRAFLSLVGARRIGVLVIGEVARPGRHDLTAFGTVLDALFAAGGITRDGSLRRIRVMRPGGGHGVDLYDVLVAGAAGRETELRLRDGDRIVVPPVGPTLAVAGAVKRPGIYELPLDRKPLSLAVARELAGGTLRPGAHRALRLGIEPSGRETATEVTAEDEPRFGDGDVLLLTPARDLRTGAVVLAGHVYQAGPRALEAAATLGRLVRTEDLRPNPYLPFAALETTDPTTRARVLAAVDLQAVLNGRGDRSLRDDDVLIVLGADDIDFLTSEAVLALLRGASGPEGACAGLTVLARTLAAEPDGPMAGGPLALAAARLVGGAASCPPVFEQYPDLLAFALDHAALVRTGVPRPGFYPTATRTALSNLTRAAGGSRGQPAQVESTAPASGGPARPEPAVVGRGDIVESAEPRFDLLGHVRHPGTRGLKGAPTLRAALGGGRVLADGVYPLFAVIDRFDRSTLTRQLIPFAPGEVVAGRYDRRLADRDRVILFGAEAMRTRLASAASPPRRGEGPWTGSAEDGTRPAADAVLRPADPKNGKADRAEKADKDDKDDRDDDEPEAAGMITEDGQPAADDLDPALAALLGERAVQVRGAVRVPGAYPVADRVRLDALVAAAGGLTRSGDGEAVEVVRAAAVAGAKPGTAPQRRTANLRVGRDAALTVGAGDRVRVAVRPGTTAEVQVVGIYGEVRRPGEYEMLRGETLSALIERAGGPTGQAHVAATVFTRESARRRERASYRRAARELAEGLATRHLNAETSKSEQVTTIRDLIRRLRSIEPIGRITVEADPAVLRAHPERDILLEARDRIYVPRLSPLVAVTGEVLSPATLRFASGKAVREYVRESGGPTRYADEGRSFVILPDGSARPVWSSAWESLFDTVPAGSTIVVPRDLRAFDDQEFFKDLGQFFSQIAVASTAIISIMALSGAP